MSIKHQIYISINSKRFIFGILHDLVVLKYSPAHNYTLSLVRSSHSSALNAHKLNTNTEKNMNVLLSKTKKQSLKWWKLHVIKRKVNWEFNCKKDWPGRDLNTQPSDLESDALPLRHQAGRSQVHFTVFIVKRLCNVLYKIIIVFLSKISFCPGT